MFLHLPLIIWLSLVLTGLAVSDCGLSLLQACVSILLGDQISLGAIWVWRVVAQGQLQGADRNRKVPVPGGSLVPMPWRLWEGPSWARNLSRSGGLTCAHRCVSTPGKPALSWWYLGMEHCGTGSAPAADMLYHYKRRATSWGGASFLDEWVGWLLSIYAPPLLKLDTSGLHSTHA